MSWQKEKPKLKKDHCLLCCSVIGFTKWVFCYDIKEREDGELMLMNDDEQDCDYPKFKYAFYKLIKYPESEVGK